MAFKNPSAPTVADDEIGPFQELEYSWGFWGVRFKRTVYTYHVYYAIDDAGGETPAATWSVGGVTYLLRSAGPTLAYLDKTGIYEAVYFYEGKKTPV